jgi:hypothetical protein
VGGALVRFRDSVMFHVWNPHGAEGARELDAFKAHFRVVELELFTRM